MHIGKKIQLYLIEHGITQKELSKETGISASKLSLSFEGKRKLTIPEYELICWALDVKPDKFMSTPQSAKRHSPLQKSSA